MVRALDLQLTVMSSNPSYKAIFRIFKLAAAAILDYENFTFSTVGTVKSAEPRHYGKFCRNRLNRGRDVAIFGSFKMAAAVILILKIVNF